MTILILATEEDAHARAVVQAIAGLGGEAVIADLSAFPRAGTLTMALDCCGGGHAFRLDLGRGPIDIAACGSAWWRRPQPAEIGPEIRTPSHRAFAVNEAQEALAGLWFAMGGFWINPPERDDKAGRKGYQLRVAQQLELDIPTTLMTNDPGEALRFLDSRGYRDVIFKSFSSTVQEWRETRLIGRDEIALIENVRFTPLIFQEYVPAVYDLRITVVGERVFPVAIHSQQTAYPVDSRIDIINARMEQVEIPAVVEAKLLAMMTQLGLVYAAIDMRLTPDGDYIFLELNPAGQWLFVDPACDHAITAEMARRLVDGDRHAA